MEFYQDQSDRASLFYKQYFNSETKCSCTEPELGYYLKKYVQADKYFS